MPQRSYPEEIKFLSWIQCKRKRKRSGRAERYITYCKYNDSADSNSDQKHHLVVVAAVFEFPVWFHQVKMQD